MKCILIEGLLGSWVRWEWGSGGLLRSRLVGGGFLVVNAGDTMKVTRQRDLIAAFLVFCELGQCLSRV